MIIQRLPLAGAVVVREVRIDDERGSFVRVLDLPQLAGMGLPVGICQVSMAHNTRAGTIRGMHYQVAPHEEAKVVWCPAGRALDVLVDVRPHSATYGQWAAVELDPLDPVAVLIPPGIAHGYQTLSDNTTLTYLISAPYSAESARSLRWDDPTVGIDWPMPVTSISTRDAQAPAWPPRS